MTSLASCEDNGRRRWSNDVVDSGGPVPVDGGDPLGADAGAEAAAGCEGVVCPDFELCAMTTGEPACDCRPGFERVSGACVDLDECKDVSCSAGQMCVNRPGDYECRAAGCGPRTKSIFGGEARAVAYVDGMAYVANGYGGLYIYDVTDLDHPRHVGLVDTPGFAYGLTVVNGYAFVADYGAGLTIIDVVDPAKPRVVATVKTTAWAFAVQIADGYAYVLDGAWESAGFGRLFKYGGLQVIDVHNPAAPVLRGTLPFDGVIGTDLQIVDHTAYVAAGKLLVLDIADPDAPAIVSATGIASTYASGVRVSGNRAYVADLNHALQIVDISTPTAPQALGRVTTAGYPYHLALEGTTVYLADSSDDRVYYDSWTTGLRIIDVSDSGNPVLKQSLDTAGTAFDVVVANGHAFVADGWGGLQIVAVEKSPAELGAARFAPMYVAKLDMSGATLFSNRQIIDMTDVANPRVAAPLDAISCAMKVVDRFAYVARTDGVYCGGSATSSRLVTLDAGDIQSPRTRGTVSVAGQITDIDVQQGRAYVVAKVGADAEAQHTVLYIVDVVDPDNPTVMAQLSTAGVASGISFAGGLAYIADGTSGLQVVDVHDPAAPVTRGRLAFEKPATWVKTIGNYAYVLANELKVVDVSDPDAPVLKGQTRTSHVGAFIADGFAYCVDGVNSHLDIIDLADPQHPELVSTVNLSVWCESVVVSGGYAFVGDNFRRRGIEIVDVARRRNPSVLAHLDMSSFASLRDLQAQGQFAYVSGWTASASSVQIVDLSDPASPRLRGRIDVERGALDVALAGQLMAIRSVASFSTVDVASPDAPVTLGTLPLPVRATGQLAFAGDQVYVPMDQELQVVDVSTPAAPALGVTLPLGASVRQVSVSGSRAYVTLDSKGLVVLNIDDPAQPAVMGAVGTHSSSSLFVEGGYAYMATTSGLVIADVRTPETPQIVATVPVVNPSRVFVSGTLAYVASWPGGLQVLDVTVPSAPSVLSEVVGIPGAPSAIVEKDGELWVTTRFQLLRIAPLACSQTP